MNIFILSLFLPYPLTQGGKIRIFNIIKYLSRNHKITLACLSDKEVSAYGPLAKYCEEIITMERKPNFLKDFCLFLFGHAPFNYVRYSSNSFRDAMKKLLKKKSFDLIQIEFALMWQYADIFKGIPSVLDAHNIECKIIGQIKDSCRNPLRKFLYVMEEKKLRAKEEQAWRECSLCFTVSDKEQDVIASYLGHSDRIFTIPNGVDLKRFKFLSKTDSGKQLLFLGGTDYQPSLDSALYFLKEIFPLVQSKTSDVKLDIVGCKLHGLANYISIKGVKLHENVPEALPYFRKADVLVVPLRYGAGTRIKILEAMAAGLSVVTTPKGCEGIDVKHGEHLMIAGSPDSFASAVQRLLKDVALRNTVTKNARSLVEKKFSWEMLVRDMEKFYDKIIK